MEKSSFLISLILFIQVLIVIDSISQYDMPKDSRNGLNNSALINNTDYKHKIAEPKLVVENATLPGTWNRSDIGNGANTTANEHGISGSSPIYPAPVISSAARNRSNLRNISAEVPSVWNRSVNGSEVSAPAPATVHVENATPPGAEDRPTPPGFEGCFAIISVIFVAAIISIRGKGK